MKKGASRTAYPQTLSPPEGRTVDTCRRPPPHPNTSKAGNERMCSKKIRLGRRRVWRCSKCRGDAPGPHAPAFYFPLCTMQPPEKRKKNPLNPYDSRGLSCTPGRIRTCDLQSRSLTLYPTELQALVQPAYCSTRNKDCQSLAHSSTRKSTFKNTINWPFQKAKI